MWSSKVVCPSGPCPAPPCPPAPLPTVVLPSHILLLVLGECLLQIYLTFDPRYSQQWCHRWRKASLTGSGIEINDLKKTLWALMWSLYDMIIDSFSLKKTKTSFNTIKWRNVYETVDVSFNSRLHSIRHVCDCVIDTAHTSGHTWTDGELFLH